MSLSLETTRIREQVERHETSGRRHWDIFRYLYSPSLIRDATQLVLRNAGSAGIDKQTCDEVRAMGETFVERLVRKLRERTYTPRAVRRVYIPKGNGKQRPLGIPTVEDRVVQRALVLLLEPVYEREFLPSSYGFRPGRRATDCVKAVAESCFRNRYVFEADIKGFFDHVQHRKLLGMLRNKIVDSRLLQLIEQILKAGALDVRTGRSEPGQQGTPQGGPASPLLANIYLHYSLDKPFGEFAKRFSGVHLFRFADDFVATCSDGRRAIHVQNQVREWLRGVRLELEPSKTRIVDMSSSKRSHASKFDFLGYKLHLRSFKDRPHRYWIARQPSEKARRALHSRLKVVLSPHLQETEARSRLLQVWRGWSGYFRHGNSNRILRREARNIDSFVLYYLRRKYRHTRKPLRWQTLYRKANWITSGLNAPCVVST